MSTRKRPRSRKTKRPVADYIAAARRFAPLVPSLKKYARRRTKLLPHEKAAIARKENLLKNITNLIPVDEKFARAKKHDLFVPDVYRWGKDEKGNKYRYRVPGKSTQGLRAMRLENSGNIEGPPKIDKKTGDIMIRANKRLWHYRDIPDEGGSFKKRLANEARELFEEMGPAYEEEMGPAYEIERLAGMAKKALAEKGTQAIYLWTCKGRTSRGFRDFDEFLLWLEERFVKYIDPEAWILGLAIWT